MSSVLVRVMVLALAGDERRSGTVVPVSTTISAAKRPAAAAGGWLKSWAPKALHLGVRFAVAAALVSAVLIVGVAVLCRVTMRRALARRVRYAVLPTDSFDPPEEEILRFAGQLARTRSVVGRPLARSATAVRIRIDALADGRLLYGLEAPAKANSLVRSVRYHQAELRPASEFDASASPIGDDDIDNPSTLASLYEGLAEHESTSGAKEGQ